MKYDGRTLVKYLPKKATGCLTAAVRTDVSRTLGSSFTMAV